LEDVDHTFLLIVVTEERENRRSDSLKGFGFAVFFNLPLSHPATIFPIVVVCANKSVPMHIFSSPNSLTFLLHYFSSLPKV